MLYAFVAIWAICGTVIVICSHAYCYYKGKIDGLNEARKILGYK